MPLDVEDGRRKRRQDHRLLIVDEGWAMCGVGAELGQAMNEIAFDELDAPVGRLHTEPVSHPLAPSLERADAGRRRADRRRRQGVMAGRAPVPGTGAPPGLRRPAAAAAAAGASGPAGACSPGRQLRPASDGGGEPITMPFGDLTVSEGTIVRWAKAEGDMVKAGELVAEIETDKAVVEIEAPVAGRLAIEKRRAHGRADGRPYRAGAGGERMRRSAASAPRAAADRTSIGLAEALFQRRTLSRAEGPLYRQLADVLRRPIEAGDLPVGSELPKEAHLASRFGVSLITVRQALRDLEGEGLIRKRAAKPALVTASDARMQPSFQFANFTDIAAFTRNASLRVLSYRRGRVGGIRAAPGPCRERRISLAVASPQRRPETGRNHDILSGGGRKGSQAEEDFTDVLIFRTVQRKLGVRLTVAHITIGAEVADAGLGRQRTDARRRRPGVDRRDGLPGCRRKNVELTVARHPADRFSIKDDAPNDLA